MPLEFNIDNATLSELQDLRDFINCHWDYTLTVKQHVMDDLTRRIRDKNLAELMKPIVEDFIRERGGTNCE